MRRAKVGRREKKSKDQLNQRGEYKGISQV